MVQARRLLPELEEDVAHDIFGLQAVADLPLGPGEDVRGEPVVELREGIVITRGDGCQQLVVTRVQAECDVDCGPQKTLMFVEAAMVGGYPATVSSGAANEEVSGDHCQSRGSVQRVYRGGVSELLRVTPGFRLADVDPDSTPGFDGGKKAGERELAAGAAELADLQERLYAQSLFGGEKSLLLVLQAMDTAGKGGIVGHVVGQVNPQGVKAFAFKSPTPEEKSHDFLWRVRKQLPPHGYLGVFDRSHYEDVLIHRVRGFSTPEVVEQRYGLINDFEAELAAEGTTVVKVMLHIGADEQKKRLAARLDRPEKNWKYNPGDVDERELWPAYQEAYQVVFDRTSTPDAPWSVIPANHKWYARLSVQRLLLDALRGMALEWPEADYDVEAEKKRLAAT